MTTADNTTYLSELHQRLNRDFSLEEMRTLCFQLNIDHESVPGAEKPSLIRNLLLGLAREGRLPELVALAAEERPRSDWPPVPAGFQLPTGLANKSAAEPVAQYHLYGDVIQGDKIGGDKVAGDKITVGDVSGSGIAIGRGATASVNNQTPPSTLDLTPLFAPLLVAVAQEAPTAVPTVLSLQTEANRGDEAGDEKMADLIADIAVAAPGAVATLLHLFNAPEISPTIGDVTRYMLRRIQK